MTITCQNELLLRTENMNIKTKNSIRVGVVAAILSWPLLETYRLWDTTQKMTEAQALERSVRTKLEAARAKHVQVANASSPAATAAGQTKP